MTKKRSKRSRSKRGEAANATTRNSYREAMANVAKARVRGLTTPVTINNPPYPGLLPSPATQVKLHTMRALMAVLGRGPVEDIPVEQSIKFRRIRPEVLAWLEQKSFFVCRSFAPLETDYIRLFAGGQALPKPGANERFYSHLVHMLLLEAQLALAKQYYMGLELDRTPPTDMIWELLATEHGVDVDDVVEESRLANLNNVSIDEFHGRIFLECFVYSVRAQWDKLIRLGDIAFGLNTNWRSFDDGLKTLEELPLTSPLAAEHITILKSIAEERLAEGSWLRVMRDTLAHKTGRHSSGVLPQTKSLETTHQLWLHIQDEHHWFREAFVALMVVLIVHRSILENI